SSSSMMTGGCLNTIPALSSANFITITPDHHCSVFCASSLTLARPGPSEIGNYIAQHPMQPITAIILAAGRSRRFGRDKRLEPIDNVPMLLRTAQVYQSVVPDTVVVLGPADHELAALLA